MDVNTALGPAARTTDTIMAFRVNTGHGHDTASGSNLPGFQAAQTMDLNVAFRGNMEPVHKATGLSRTTDTNMALGNSTTRGYLHGLQW